MILCASGPAHSTRFASGLMPKKARISVSRAAIVGSNRHTHSAVGAPKARNVKTGQPEEKGIGAFRFWTDARRFKGSEEKCIVQQALYESGGVRTGGYPKASPVAGPLGFQRPGDWDLLWSPARLALRALPVKPGQLVSACPGLMSVTRKRKLSLTLKEALGEEEAFRIMPRTYSLPAELDAWQQHLTSTSSAQQAAAAAAGSSNTMHQKWQKGSEGLSSEVSADGPSTSGSSGGAEEQQQQQLWILKTAQHLGKGLKLLPAEQAVREGARKRLKSSKKEKPYVQAQQYVANPLLIQGRKFGIRVWVLVTGHNPLRVYMHKNGLVLFSTHSYSNESWSTDDGGVALGHVTNYAQNMDGMVWDLDQLHMHLGDDVFQQLWRRIARSTALVFSAALPHMKAEHQAMDVAPGSTFELLGLDYLVDSDMHPWLLEVNGTPSLTVCHENPVVEQLIHKQKSGMVRDMVSILNVQQRFKARYAAMRLAAGGAVNNAAASVAEEDTAASEDGMDDAGAMGVDDDSEAAVAMAVDEGEASAGSVQVASASANNAVGRQVAAGRGVVVGAGATSAIKDMVVLRKRLQEEMNPTTDEGVWTRVRQELQSRGGFQSLMPMFPVPRGANMDMSVAGRLPWDARDLEMPAMMRKINRQVARASVPTSAAKSPPEPAS